MQWGPRPLRWARSSTLGPDDMLVRLVYHAPWILALPTGSHKDSHLAFLLQKTPRCECCTHLFLTPPLFVVAVGLTGPNRSWRCHPLPVTSPRTPSGAWYWSRRRACGRTAQGGGWGAALSVQRCEHAALPDPQLLAGQARSPPSALGFKQQVIATFVLPYVPAGASVPAKSSLTDTPAHSSRPRILNPHLRHGKTQLTVPTAAPESGLGLLCDPAPA